MAAGRAIDDKLPIESLSIPVVTFFFSSHTDSRLHKCSRIL